MEEVVCAATMKAFLRIGGEAKGGASHRGSGQLRALGKNGVQLAAIPGGNILDVIQPLEPPLYLERADSGIDQCPQVGGLVHILE